MFSMQNCLHVLRELNEALRQRGETTQQDIATLSQEALTALNDVTDLGNREKLKQEFLSELAGLVRQLTSSAEQEQLQKILGPIQQTTMVNTLIRVNGVLKELEEKGKRVGTVNQESIKR